MIDAQGANSVRCQKTPRDVLAERIAQWAGEAGVYDYADRLITDLASAGWEITPEPCLAEGCIEELGARRAARRAALIDGQDPPAGDGTALANDSPTPPPGTRFDGSVTP